jgi:pyrimidine-nucleoside phosphorylase
MNAVEILAKKRDGGELTKEEIRFFVEGVTSGAVPDYQASAWLMAVFLRGMTARETLDLTLAMCDSGQRVDLSDLPNGPALDKHSTGGVGDKTTLVVVPILAAAGVPMLKMSGRGLGYSGGTVDKLESIPGFRTDLSIAEAKAQVERIDAALIAQSAELAPADKVLYALRDVTATVESLPLIASSIMSKKLAGGAQRIVLDVKVGRGAFMKTREQAEALARAMVAIGMGANVPTSAMLTAMEEPLGKAVGNALEVAEAIELLQNRPESDRRFRSLCLELAGHGLVAVGKARDRAKGATQAERLLASGAAAAKFAQIIAAQGGPEGLENVLAALPVAPIQQEVPAKTAGVVGALDAEAVGRLAVRMGAGREVKTDVIDPSVGIVLRRKVGDAVAVGDPLAVLHLDATHTGEFETELQAAFTLVPPAQAPKTPTSVVTRSTSLESTKARRKTIKAADKHG